MKENLWRGKRTSNDKWIYGNLVDRTIGVFPLIVTRVEREDNDDLYWDFEPVYPNSTGHYSGWRDKNGVDIYTGDIVRYVTDDYGRFEHTGVVVFKDGAYQIQYKSEWGEGPVYHRIGKIDEWRDMGASGTIQYTYEVIGNTYDNPNLVNI